MAIAQAVRIDSTADMASDARQASPDPMAAFVPPSVVLQRTAKRLGSREAYFVRREHGWEATSWQEYGEQVSTAARALLSLGVRRGDAVAVLSFNRPEWAIIAFAAMSIGAMPAGIYWTSSTQDIAYVLNHSKAPILFVEDENRLASVTASTDELPHLKTIVSFKDLAGLSVPCNLPLSSWQDFLSRHKETPESALQQRTSALTPDDIGTLIYTSGTTGPSKAVALSQGNLWWTATTMVQICKADEHDRLISYLPLAHAAEQMGGMHNQAHSGLQMFYATSMETLGDHLKEVQPTVFFGVPRVWEKMQAAIETKLDDAKGFKAHLARWAMGVGQTWHKRKLAGQPTGALLDFKRALANKLIYQKVQAALGFQHARLLSSGAAPIAPESLKFFTGLDLVIREVYGQSEVSGPSTMSLEGSTRIGSVGKTLPGTEMRVAEDGELLVRGPHVFKGYMGQPAATAETMSGAWLLTGDLGHIDEDGYVYITGRKKDLIITSGGKNISPANIEAALMDTHMIEHAVVAGDGRNYLTALVTLDQDALKAFARSHGLAAEQLDRHPDVLKAVQLNIDHVNQSLARVAQIRKFAVLSSPMTVQGGELTPTLKVKRKIVLERNKHIVDSLYAGTA